MSIVHPNFNRKRRWTKETNFGDANKWLACLKLVWFYMQLMVIASSVRMEAIMNILIGLSWQKKNGRRLTKLPELRAVVGCVEAWNMTVRSHGETLTIRLTTYDCTALGHYGYAYFVLGCSDGKIQSLSCGDKPTESFTAPDGFKESS